jgi:hypothetical protein
MAPPSQLVRKTSTLRHAVGAIAGPIRVRKSNNAVVAVSIAVVVAVAFAVEVQLKVCCVFEILEHSLCCSHMAGEWTGIVSAESSDCV